MPVVMLCHWIRNYEANDVVGNRSSERWTQPQTLLNAIGRQHCRCTKTFDARCHRGARVFYLALGARADSNALACERLANADTAAAWHVMVFNAACLMAVQWPQELVEMLWGSDPTRWCRQRPYLLGQRKRRLYPINGRQRFVSGCDHATWLLSPVMIDDGHGAHLAECRSAKLEYVRRARPGAATVVNDLAVPIIHGGTRSGRFSKWRHHGTLSPPVACGFGDLCARR